MPEPTCRACYAATLTDAERERFNAEPVTSCVFLCADHQRAMDDALAGFPPVQLQRVTDSVLAAGFTPVDLPVPGAAGEEEQP